MLVSIFKISKLIAIIFSLSYFFGVIWHIIIKDIIPWDNLGSTDVYNEHVTFYTYDQYKLKGETENIPSLMKMWYYSITTITTVGYGDFSPKAVDEKFIMIFVMYVFVNIYSFVYG